MTRPLFDAGSPLPPSLTKVRNTTGRAEQITQPEPSTRKEEVTGMTTKKTMTMPRTAQQTRARFQALAHPGDKTTGYQVNAAAGAASGSSATIYLYDSIGSFWGVLASDFVKELADLDVDEITVHINSPGGDVFEGIAIMNALRHHRARVTTVVDGLAASAASFIAVGAGEECVMSLHSEMFIHEAWGLAIGDADDMRELASDLDRVSDNIAGIYARKAGGDAATWRAAMRDDTWYSAAQAVEAGLADRLDEDTDDEDDEAASKNRWDTSIFAHHPSRPAAAAGGITRPGHHTHVTTPDGHTHVAVAADHHSHTHVAAHTLPGASASGSTPRVAPAPGDTTQEGAADVFNDEQLDILRQSLGVAAEADAGTILAALTALAERADDPAASTTNRPPVPEGMDLIETDQLDTLRTDAAAGRAARDQQLAEARDAVVNTAVRDGRVSPARRDHWVARLAADPGEEEVLAALPKIVPLDEIGHAVSQAESLEHDKDNATYAAVYGDQSQKGA